MIHIPFLLGWAPMSLTSLSFLYLFLPLSLAVYYIIPHGARPVALLACSIGYCALAQPQSILPMLLSVMYDFVMIRLMERWDTDDSKRRLCLWTCVVKNLALLIVAGSLIRLRTGAMLLGTVIYTVSSQDAVTAMYRREVPYERNTATFLLNGVFYPRLYFGPVQPYREFSQQLRQIHFHSRSIFTGLGQLSVGAVKVVMFGGGLTDIYNTIHALSSAEMTVLSHWTMIISFAFAVYYVMSGYGDMAQGISAMYGIFLPQNFYYPYQSRNVGDFFERFNMTAAALIRRNVLSPLTGDNQGKLAGSLNIILFGLIFGAWVGVRWNFLLWGVYIAVFAAIEYCVHPKFLSAVPRIIGRIYTFCIILSAFTIMAGETIGQSLEMARGMFSFSSLPLFNTRILYIISANWLVLLLSVLFCTNIFSLLVNWMHRQIPRVTQVLLGVLSAILFAVVTVLLV